jgi:hypothetical protein
LRRVKGETCECIENTVETCVVERESKASETKEQGGIKPRTITNKREKSRENRKGALRVTQTERRLASDKATAPLLGLDGPSMAPSEGVFGGI